MKDIVSAIDLAIAIDPATYTANNTPAAIDLQNFDAASIVIAIGVGGITFDTANKIEFQVTHSDDDVTYTDVADDDIIGATGITTGIVKALTAAHPSASVHRFGYRGGKRYLKVLANFSGTHAVGTPIAAFVMQGHPHHATYVSAAG